MILPWILASRDRIVLCRWWGVAQLAALTQTVRFLSRGAGAPTQDLADEQQEETEAGDGESVQAWRSIRQSNPCRGNYEIFVDMK